MTARKCQAVGAGVAILALALVTAFVLLPMRRDGTNTSVEDQESPPNGGMSRGVRIATLARARLTLTDPKPNSEYRLGEAMRVKGYLEVPGGQTIFGKEVYLQNLSLTRHTPAAIYSCNVPLDGHGSRYSFETTRRIRKPWCRNPEVTKSRSRRQA